jgi:D-3-phosphoglycerate dehydrogenase / 2-oxoglutarate reductase
VLNENKPGVIGSIGTILGRRAVNVASVQLGLNRTTNEAVSVWNLDSSLGEEGALEIKQAPNVARVIPMRLD